MAEMQKKMKAMRSGIIFLTVIILLSIFISLASSEIYKWKNKDGNIFYSDSPPAGVDAQKKKFREDRIERQEIKEGIYKSESNKLKEDGPCSDVKVIMYMTS